jgi:Immunity protein Imm1
MTFTIGWKDGHATVATAAEAEAALDRIVASGDGPLLLHVAPDDGGDALIQMVWGDPERAMLTYTEDEFGGRAVEPGMPLAPRDLDYDYGSIEPDRTRLSARMARAAVAEFVATGRRPTCVTWEQ